MIYNPDWFNPGKRPHYFYQISSECLKKLAECMNRFENGEMDDETCFRIIKQSLIEEIEDAELLTFTIRNLSTLFDCIESGRLSIRIHRDSSGKIWLAAHQIKKPEYIFRL